MNFTSNTERRAFWNEVQQNRPTAAIERALATMGADTVRVLRSHYEKDKTFAEIAGEMDRSLTFVRTHHNRGIFKLHKYFNA